MLPKWLSGKESACQCRRHRRLDSIPGLGRSSGEGNGKSLQSSWLENSTNRRAWWTAVHEVPQSWTQLSDWAHTQLINICNHLPSLTIWQCLPYPQGFPSVASGEEPAGQCRRCKRSEFNPWVRKIPWRRAWPPSPVLLLENPMDRGTWQATVHGTVKSQTWLKWLSMQTGLILITHSHTHTHTHTCSLRALYSWIWPTVFKESSAILATKWNVSLILMGRM